MVIFLIPCFSEPLWKMATSLAKVWCVTQPIYWPCLRHRPILEIYAVALYTLFYSFACKEIELQYRNTRLVTMEVFTIILSATQLLYVAALCGPVFWRNLLSTFAQLTHFRQFEVREGFMKCFIFLLIKCELMYFVWFIIVQSLSIIWNKYFFFTFFFSILFCLSLTPWGSNTKSSNKFIFNF